VAPLKPLTCHRSARACVLFHGFIAVAPLKLRFLVALDAGCNSGDTRPNSEELSAERQGRINDAVTRLIDVLTVQLDVVTASSPLTRYLAVVVTYRTRPGSTWSGTSPCTTCERIL